MPSPQYPQRLHVSRSCNEVLPQFPRPLGAVMQELRPASQPFQGTETQDAGMPQGTDSRTPGWFGRER